MTLYPVLTGEIAKRGIKKTAIARSIGISDRSLRNRFNGVSDFTWPEVETIRKRFFPDMSAEELFVRADLTAS